jgi:hypothetical protein
MAADEQELAALRQLQALVAYPRETLDVELKGWLDITGVPHQADLMKAILALANHGGGYVLIGYREENGTWVPDEASRPATFAAYNQDRLNGLVANYAEPSFHCELHHVAHPQTGAVHPVIRVPGGTVPIRARRDGAGHVRVNSYYIRRPGPSSDTPSTGREWDGLIGRCIRVQREQLLDDLRRILEGRGLAATLPEPTAEERLDEWAAESRQRWADLVALHGQNHPREQAEGLYEHGTYDFAYIVEGNLQQPNARELLAVLDRAQGHETGWPEWLVAHGRGLEPRVIDGMVEALLIESMFGDPAHADYWRASRDARLYLLRGYEEDSEPGKRAPGTAFDFTIPIWRAGEALLHAERVARELGDENSVIHFRANWRGLEGRTLRSLFARRLVEPRVSHTDSVVSYAHATAAEIGADLPDIVRGLLVPLYESFEFLEVSPQVVEEELNEMRQRG